MSGQEETIDSDAIAIQREHFLQNLASHSCPRCRHGHGLDATALSEHECRHSGRAVSVMRRAGRERGVRIPPPGSFRSSRMYRELLPVLFGQLFFVHAHAVTPGFDFLIEKRMHDRALCATLDAGGLVHMGYVTDNPRFKQAAVERYSQAIHELRKSIEQPDVDSTMVMLCIIYLQICAAFGCIADASGGWIVHGRALERLMCTHGSGSMSFAAQTCFTGHMRMFTLWSAIMRRKRLDFSRDFWADRFIGCDFSNFIRLNSATMRVPGLLEDCDEVCRRRMDAATVADCMAAISALEGELNECVYEGYAETTHRQPYRTVSRLPVDDERIKHPGQPDLFPRLYDFPNVSTAGVHVNHWMCLLALRQAQLDIRKSVTRSRYPSDLPIYRDLRTMTAWAAECADNLCMCVPYMMQAKNGYIGLMCAMGPVHMALQWYRRQNEPAKASWCEGIIDYLHFRGIGTPLTEVESIHAEAHARRRH